MKIRKMQILAMVALLSVASFASSVAIEDTNKMPQWTLAQNYKLVITALAGIAPLVVLTVIQASVKKLEVHWSLKGVLLLVGMVGTGFFKQVANFMADPAVNRLRSISEKNMGSLKPIPAGADRLEQYSYRADYVYSEQEREGVVLLRSAVDEVDKAFAYLFRAFEKLPLVASGSYTCMPEKMGMLEKQMAYKVANLLISISQNYKEGLLSDPYLAQAVDSQIAGRSDFRRWLEAHSAKVNETLERYAPADTYEACKEAWFGWIYSGPDFGY